MAERLKLDGRVFGRLQVLSEGEKAKNGAIKWQCLCQCGNTKEVVGSSLVAGLTTSCGCFHKEVRKTAVYKHGKSRTREYTAWQAMKQRCYYEKHDCFHLYGGRGIVVSPLWKDSFESFYDDMGDCPEGMSLERINCNRNYEPSNCKWDTASNQAYNQNIRPSNTSGRTGVNFHKATGKWAASIRENGKSKHLGVFINFEDAVETRAKAEMAIYGRVKE